MPLRPRQTDDASKTPEKTPSPSRKRGPAGPKRVQHHSFQTWFLVCFGVATVIGLSEFLFLSQLSEPSALAFVANHDRFKITFVGDTMLGNLAINFASQKKNGDVIQMNWTIASAFAGVRHLLQNSSDFVVGNLEGPISPLDASHDPYTRGPAYSFGMDPRVADEMKRVGFDAVGLANNHYFDRGLGGHVDTLKHLRRAGIRYFGIGQTRKHAGKPLIVKTHFNGVTLGIAGMSELYKATAPAGKDPDQPLGFLTPTEKDAKLAVRLMEEKGVTKKIAFVHWGDNYVPSIQANRLDKKAKILVEAGFDMVIGSDGSHLTQEFAFVDGTPVLYSVGNFVFHTPGRFHQKTKSGNRCLPYGTVTHVTMSRDGALSEVEIHCIVADNRITNFVPRICTGEESNELFAAMGEHVRHERGKSWAVVTLQQ